MVAQKVIVVVEDVDAARSALRWAIRNLFRNGDLITLLHVYPSSRSRNKQKLRTQRLNGFQLALSFKELCIGFPEVKVEIIVTEGDQGATIASLVKETGASTLVVGLHEKSFIYRSAAAHSCINDLNCRLLAVKPTSAAFDGTPNAEFSQIETVSLCASQPKTPCQSFPSSLGMIWRSRRRKGST
ncbi:uncharacterized protein LOC131235466 [Magnolia sinica]|uniref:uncharacterized protein LOC131235466 n=1 Tax=Magnolia sinica TaxID=86752 RepID=UPI002658D435|nr:uncharacterized protein LOC131235466 [Magnolia sinica]